MGFRFSPKTISLSFGILVLLFSLSFIAFAWTEPTLAPPSGNADAPLNVGTTAQTKNARLSVTELYDANDSAYYLNPNGQSVFSGPLGIGTTGPATPLHVSGASIFGGDSRFNLRLDDTAAFAAGVGAGIQFVGKIDASGTLAGFASIKGIKENGTSGNPSGALSLITNSNTGSNIERMRIDSSGNVGIGTTTPSEKLTVVGEVGLRDGTLWQPVYPSDDGLILYLPFSENTGTKTYDKGPYGYDGTLANTTWTIGKYGNALNFNGANSYAAVGNLGTIPAQGTISFWMNSSEIINYRNPMTTKYNGTNAGIRFEEYTVANFVAITGDDSGGNVVGREYIPAGQMQANKWYNIVFIWDKTNNKEIGYLDGVQKFNASRTVWYTTFPDFRIGTGFDTSAARQWKGSVDEVRVYNRALSADEIRTQYLQGLQSQGYVKADNFKIINTNAAELLRVTSAGNVGIGVSSPNTALDLNGALSVRAIAAPSVSPAAQGRIYFDSTANVFKVSENGGAFVNLVGGSSQWTTSGSNIYYNAGNVGIGTTGPTNKLSVGDDISAFAGGNAIVMGKTTANSAIGVGQSGTDFLSMQWNYNAVPANAYAEFYSGNHNIVFTPGTGKIGIGTATPGMKLDILPGTGVETAFRIQSSGGVSDNFYIGQWGGTGSNWNLGGQNAGTMNLYINRNAAAGDVIIGATNGGANSRVLMIQGSTGNVGIGTTGPDRSLTIANTSGANYMNIKDGTHELLFGVDSSNVGIISMMTNHGLTIRTGGNADRVRIDAAGNVGIGTAGPLGRLDVQGPAARTGTHASSPSFYVTGTLLSGQTGPAAGNIEFRHDNGTQGIGFGYNTIYQTGSNTNQELNLLSRGTSPITLNAYPYSTGNVGIGTTTPSSKLTVAGVVESTGFKLIASPSAGYVLTSDASGVGTWQAPAGGVSSGISITTTSPYPPSGYTYTGNFTAVQPEPDDFGDYWNTKTAMPTIRMSLAVAAVNNKVYAIGGYNGADLSTNEEYDPVANTWSTKTAMPTARSALAADSVNNKIYAIGGSSGSSILSTNEEYNPATNTWATKTAMPTARGALAADSVNNKIYAIGGMNSSFLAITVNEEYDPSANTWATKTAMPTARRNISAAPVNNKIYVIGGINNSSVYLNVNEEYNPSANTWATKTAMPTARVAAVSAANNKVYAIGGENPGVLNVNEEYDPSFDVWINRATMTTARRGSAAATINSKIYTIGGTASGVYLGTNEEYQVAPLTNVWAAKTVLPTARHSPAVAVVNNKLYAIGGNNGTIQVGTNEEYNPATNTWATKTAMPTVREQAAAAMVNGIIYVVGGWNSGGPLTNNEAYNPLADTWTGKTSMQARRYGLAAVTVRGKIYALGGATWCGPFNDWCSSGANEEYNPSANTWVYKTGIPNSHSCSASQANLAAAVANNKIYAVGGDSSPQANPNICIYGFNHEYDPLFDTWTVKTDMRYARKYLAAASVNNKIYAIGGWNNGTRYDQMEEYDPVTNTWTNKKSMSSQRYLPAAGVVYNKIYVVGGYTTNVLNNNDEYTPPATFYYIHTKN